MAYVSESQFVGVRNLPISLPQTELRRGSSIVLATVTLQAGEEMQLRYLSLHLIQILTPGVQPDEVNTGMGFAFIGVYPLSDMSVSPSGLVSARVTGVTSANPFYSFDYATPGDYSVILWNNTGRDYTKAVDLAVSVSGAFKLTSV